VQNKIDLSVLDLIPRCRSAGKEFKLHLVASVAYFRHKRGPQLCRHVRTGNAEVALLPRWIEQVGVTRFSILGSNPSSSWRILRPRNVSSSLPRPEQKVGLAPSADAALCRPSLSLDGRSGLKVCTTISRKCSRMKRYEALHLELGHFYMPPKCNGSALARMIGFDPVAVASDSAFSR